MKKIIVIGSTNTDMVIKSKRIPVPGETILGGKFMMNPGGKGANQAVAAARLGGDVMFVAKVGNDLFGSEGKKLFASEGIDTEYIFSDPIEPSGVALIMVDENGRNCISVALGANATLMPKDLEKVKKQIECASMVLMQLESPLETVWCAAKWAYEKGVRVILNPAPAMALPEELLKYLTVITPNETEAEILSGIKVHDQDTATLAAQRLCKMGVKAVLITMGAKGAFFYTPSESFMMAAYPGDPVDTTAAGDVFNGALAVALTEGKGFYDAVDFASRAAAISVTRMGAQSSAPYRHECI